MYENSLDCPVEITLQLINNKWKIRIIGSLLNGTKRFNEIKNILETITQKVLTQNLRELERDGLISRKIYPVVPPKVEYTLTETGSSLKPILDEMLKWGLWYSEENPEITELLNLKR